MSQLEVEMAPADRPRSNNHGGPRPGSGRKPKGVFAPLQGDLDFAKNLVSSLMRDESQPAELRARCALAVLIRGTSSRGSRRAIYLEAPVKPVEGPGDCDQVAPAGVSDLTAARSL